MLLQTSSEFINDNTTTSGTNSTQLALLKCKLSSERTLHGLGFDGSNLQTYLDAHINVDQFLLQIFSHQQLDTLKGAAIAGFTKLLNTWNPSNSNNNSNNTSSTTTTTDKVYTPQQDTMSVVIIDVDYWNEFPSLINNTNINNNAKYGIHIPYHGMLAIGVKFGNFLMRWTEYGIVDIINLQQFSPSTLQKSLIIKTVSTPIKYNTSNLKKIANLIIQYNTQYQYDLYDKSPIQFIRDLMECVGINFKLGKCSLLLKIIETHWKKFFGNEKCGIIINPYIESDNLYNCTDYSHFIEISKNLLQYNITYSSEYSFEWSILKSFERTLRLLSMSCTFEPSLRHDYIVNSNTEQLFGNVSINTNTLKYISSSFNIEEENSNTDKKNSDTIFVLCMDGGGTRGLILSIILREIEKRTNRKLNDIFDLVCGTSTGALTSRCVQSGLSGEEIQTLYTQLATDIFSSKLILNEKITKFYKTVSSGNWYEGSKLEALTLSKISRSKENDILYLQDLYQIKPKAFFVSTLVPSTLSLQSMSDNNSINNNTNNTSTSSNQSNNNTTSGQLEYERARSDEPISYIFRTYPCPFNKENQPTRYKGTWNGQNIPLSSCLRASTAAPVYFDKKRIGNSHFIDGGICNNNPTEIAITEMKKIFPNHTNFCVISLGTGKYVKPAQQQPEKKSWFSFGQSNPPTPSSNKGSDKITANLTTLLDIFELSMSSEAISRRVQDIVNEQTDKNITYFRLNPSLPTDIPLDSTLPEVFELMAQQTREYLRNESESFEKIIKLLSNTCK
ncbi:predicted protein [Naegleria gruberi]|uniref:Predicted protein n=1 Tax=Naegleria gruberi TaxID=5762 RepID=D2VZ98_NAEGR|nr:uncharacterized protein NAEGRDRAFT_74415 [Naegleria gruberi]EFC37755.1 predicted protein [Naegleria gruberi]|eukprot:XP_002670499.1 predicted protein [Naegleria gruberi strain NEG-M]